MVLLVRWTLRNVQGLLLSMYTNVRNYLRDSAPPRAMYPMQTVVLDSGAIRNPGWNIQQDNASSVYATSPDNMIKQ